MKSFKSGSNLKPIYCEVEYTGQELISCRWVCTEKLKGNQLTCKARLVARGFEEDSSKLSKKSPTCSKYSLRLLLSILCSKHWHIHSIDIKSAFLQGMPLKRDVYLSPPKEANTTYIWKLNHAVYGLTDACKHWYDKVKQELLALNVFVSKLDPAVFTYHKNGELQGILIVHVDDFLFGGSELFYINVIEHLRKVFVVGLEETEHFKYIGLNVAQTGNQIFLSLTDYIESIDTFTISYARKLEKMLFSLKKNTPCLGISLVR